MLVHIVNVYLKAVYRCQLHLVDFVAFTLCTCQTAVEAQIRQSARLFLQSSELGLPHPLIRSQVCPPFFGSGGRTYRIAGEGGGRGSQFGRGNRHWYYSAVYMYFVAGRLIPNQLLRLTISLQVSLMYGFFLTA